MLRVGGDFLKYGEKNLRFRNTRLRVDGQIQLEMLRADADFFQIWRKEKISVFDNTQQLLDLVFSFNCIAFILF